MKVEEMELGQLVGDLIDIGNLIEMAKAETPSHLPILFRCEEILSGELHRRLGGWTEMAEVATDALEEEVLRRRGLQEAEEIRILGTTVREIEAAEAADIAAFEAEHPEVLEALTRPVSIEDVSEALGEVQLVRAGGTPHYVDDPPLFTVADAEERAPSTAVPRHKLHVARLPECLQSEDHDPILWAMKQAAWSSLQRLETDVLVEYLRLWIKKHQDYGPENHAIWGCQGVVIRLTDKLMRLKGRYFDDRMMLTDKTEDDWLDLIGYGLIGLVVERGKWPAMELQEVLRAMESGTEEYTHVHGS
jgi:hypothetical protein